MHTDLLYLAGPTDAKRVYSAWNSDEQDVGYFGSDYLRQFLDVCKETGLSATVVSLNKGDDFSDGSFTFLFRPIPWVEKGGLRFHAGQILYMLRMVVFIYWYRHKTFLVAQCRPYWFLLLLLKPLRVRVIASIHCVLWQRFHKPRLVTRCLYAFTRWFFSHQASAILTHSSAVSDQLVQLYPTAESKVVRFLPVYPKEKFQGVTEPLHQKDPFRVLFIGRVEENKGALDLIEIAALAKSFTSREVCFDVCGDGSDFSRLRSAVRAADCTVNISLRGYCDASEVTEAICRAHVLIVPTRTEFIEGFNKVVVEGVLSGRPVVSSRVCPAVDVVERAVYIVPPNDCVEYAKAIGKLASDEALYLQYRRASADYCDRFYDEEQSWGAKLKEVLES